MRILRLFCGAMFAAAGFGVHANAQTAANLTAYRGMAPIAGLENTPSGQAALRANLAITGAIQDGTANQPTLLPFADQQQQALKDAASTTWNASQLADGLGTTLGGIYQAKAKTTSTDDGKTTNHTDFSQAVAELMTYANATTNSDSAGGKFFFANLTLPSGGPVSAEAAAILTAVQGKTDMFGRTYGLPAGSFGGDAIGNARPFQTEPHLLTYRGQSLFGQDSNSIHYLHGPAQDLRNSPSFPSGHTTYGYTESLLLAILVPERYPQMVVRAAEYGNSRVIIGAHYAMDVLAGRALAAFDLAHLLANAPGYVGVQRGNVRIDDFRKALAAARVDLSGALEAGCGAKIAVCAKEDTSRFADAARNRAFYDSTQTYGLPAAFPNNTAPEDVAKLAPEAGYLLIAAFPYLSVTQANAILTATQGPGGGFLDNGSAFGVYSRLDLLRASEQAIAAKH